MLTPAHLAVHIRARAAFVAACALALLVLGAWAASHAYHEPVTERLARHEAGWREEASFTYRVPVTRNESVWPIGTVLPMGEPTYYRSVSPRVPVAFAWSASDAGGLSGTVHGELLVRVRAEARDGRTLWELERPLENAFFAHAGDVRLSGELDLDRLVPEVGAVMQDLPPAEGRLNWSVEAVVSYALERGDEPVAGQSVYRMPVEVQDPRFKLPAAEDVAWTEDHGRTSVVTTARPAGWAGVAGSLGAWGVVGAGVTLLGLMAWAWRGDPTRGMGAAEAAFALELAGHREWVTVARAPLDERRLPPLVVEVDSLDALVQVAFDARARVVLDPRRRVFHVALPNMTYRYGRHAVGARANGHAHPAPQPRRS